MILSVSISKNSRMECIVNSTIFQSWDSNVSQCLPIQKFHNGMYRSVSILHESRMECIVKFALLEIIVRIES